MTKIPTNECRRKEGNRKWPFGHQHRGCWYQQEMSADSRAMEWGFCKKQDISSTVSSDNVHWFQRESGDFMLKSHSRQGDPGQHVPWWKEVTLCLFMGAHWEGHSDPPDTVGPDGTQKNFRWPLTMVPLHLSRLTQGKFKKLFELEGDWTTGCWMQGEILDPEPEKSRGVLLGLGCEASHQRWFPDAESYLLMV